MRREVKVTVDTSKWTGMHQGSKNKHQFHLPCKPNVKTQRRFNARILDYEKSKAAPNSEVPQAIQCGLCKPGSQRKARASR